MRFQVTSHQREHGDFRSLGRKTPSRVRGTAFTPPELVTALLGHCVRWWQILHEAHAPAGACSGERANY